MGRESRSPREDNHCTGASWILERFLASAGPGLTDLEYSVRFCRGLRGVHAADDMDLVPRKLIKTGVAEPGVEHLISVTRSRSQTPELVSLGIKTLC